GHKWTKAEGNANWPATGLLTSLLPWSIYDPSFEFLGLLRSPTTRWNDVWLTLRGQYGARSTLQNPADPESSVMYVAAPIMDGSRLIGVLSVGKP
ncbi:hypothetical protein RIM93_34830, partial [Pseudomonas aeruginosa]|nr:hypothetical protein [Pseudomonas aeruginosa]